jgi:hypothetical protein
MAVDKNLRATQGRGQFVFLPEILPSARKHRLRMGAIAAQFCGEPDDTVNVRSYNVLSALAFKRPHRFAR